MQDTATARDGLRNAVIIMVEPRGYGRLNADGAFDEGDPDALAMLTRGEGDSPGAPGYDKHITIGDITITNTDGSTGVTPTQTGTASGTATGTQTPTQTASVTTTQDIDAKVAIDLAAALAPGGVIDQALAATAAGGDGTATLDKQTQQELRSMLQGGTVTPAALETLLPAMLKLLGDQQALIEPEAGVSETGGNGSPS